LIQTMTANNFYFLRLKPLLSAAVALLAIRFCGGQGGFVMPQDVSSKAMGLVPLPVGLVDPNSKVVSAPPLMPMATSTLAISSTAAS
jgi:hypothetical protein